MPETKKIKILSDFLGSYYRTSDELLFQCPKCDHHKNKLSVNIEKDAFKCWVCDFRGRKIYHLVRRYGDYEQKKLFYQRGNVHFNFQDKLINLKQNKNRDFPKCSKFPKSPKFPNLQKKT